GRAGRAERHLGRRVEELDAVAVGGQAVGVVSGEEGGGGVAAAGRDGRPREDAGGQAGGGEDARLVGRGTDRAAGEQVVEVDRRAGGAGDEAGEGERGRPPGGDRVGVERGADRRRPGLDRQRPEGFRGGLGGQGGAGERDRPTGEGDRPAVGDPVG